MVEAGVALLGPGLPEAVLDRDEPGDRGAGIVERTGAAGRVPARRPRHSVAQVARDLGVGWSTVMTAVRDYGEPLVDDPDRIGHVDALGMDETSFLAGNQFHHTLYVTGFVDLSRHRLLDVVPGRSATSVSDWLDVQPLE